MMSRLCFPNMVKCIGMPSIHPGRPLAPQISTMHEHKSNVVQKKQFVYTGGLTSLPVGMFLLAQTK